MYFKDQKGNQEVKRILDNTDNEKSKNNKKKCHYKYSSNEEFSNSLDKNNDTEIEEFRGPLDSNVVHELSRTRQSKFDYLLLKMIITLLTCKQLSEKILNKAVDEFMTKIKETAKKDIVGITLTLDSWTNVINQNLLGSVLITSVQDVSSKRSWATDIILKVEELFNDLESEKIKVIALITDIAKYEPHNYDSSDESFELQDTSNLVLPSKICNIINDDNWWRQIKILHLFGYLFKIIKEYPDIHLSQ
ncbi:7282_t:CDS:2 [Cetraspora pellucida]|uniref:7282_t:CDS:1 n=1 Tax=Cetraspora pellucida TaxID=1433469 RepID=A0A9N9IGW9_9GLOM|nr:7282_t:CDS:2 [Cetraspora pellucida]